MKRLERQRRTSLEALSLVFIRFQHTAGRLAEELTLLANNFLSTYAFMAPRLQTTLDDATDCQHARLCSVTCRSQN